MDPLLLNIVHTPHAKDPFPDTLATITIKYVAQGLDTSGGVLTSDAAPSKKELEKLRWYLEEYWQWPYEQFLERAKEIEQSLIGFGKKLYHAVFATAEA